MPPVNPTLTADLVPHDEQAATAAAGPRAAGDAQRWELRRNCAFSPRQVLRAYAALCALTVVPAAVGTVLTSPLIAVYAVVELLLVAAALLLYARHARDRDVLTLEGGHVVVERLCGEQLQRTEFDATWLRLSESDDRDPLLKLSAGGCELCVGHHANLARRRVVLRELRDALAQARAAVPG